MAQRPKRATASPSSPKPTAADGGSPGGAPSDEQIYDVLLERERYRLRRNFGQADARNG